MKKYIISAAFALASVLTSKAVSYNTISLFDDTFSAKIGTTTINAQSPNYEVLWGTFTGGVFTPIGGSVHTGDNDGYIGDPFGSFELSATLSLSNNTTLAAGTQLYLAITSLPDDSNYVTSSFEAVLTDPTWLAPTFDAFASDGLVVSFTAQTTAVKGQFSYNNGNEIINLASSAIPEPSTYAVLAGLAVIGAAAYRKRRSA